MKNTSIVVLSVLGLAFAACAEAAPKKRTRNDNRVGPYGVGFVGQSNYTSDQSELEQGLRDTLTGAGTTTNLTSGVENTDIGYQATFGFRFNRYFAAELGLIQTGEVVTSANADVDLDGAGPGGPIPVGLKLGFAAGGPLISAVGIIPINDRFEFFGRAGYLFTAAEREFSSRVDGQSGSIGSAKGDSQDLVYGAGASFHFNQVYSVRLEYLILDEIGEAQRSGTEDLNILGLGFLVRF